MAIFYSVYRVVRRVNTVAVYMSCAAVVLMMVFTDWEVITRYFVRNPATWTYPVTSYLLLYCIYLALAYALQRGGHVSVEFLVEMVPPRVRRWLERIGHVLGLVFTLVLLYQSYRLFSRHLAEGQRDISTISAPLYMVSFALPLGLALMTVTYVLVLIDSFVRQPGEPTWQEQEKSGRKAAEQLD